MSTTEAKLTVAALECVPDDGNRYELIQGELYMSKAPELIHQRAVGEIHHALRNYLASNPIGEVLFAPGVIFSDYDAVIPDLVYVGNERRNEIASGARVYGAPDLAIEVLSPGAQNAERDRTLKLWLYGKHGVREYWIADTWQRTVETYRLVNHTLKPFRSFMASESLETPLLPGFAHTVAHFFV
jgi:Uma2 family endonuclease